MKNVYDEIRLFYEDIEWQPVVRKEWVEGFLRQKAWQGVTDQQLRMLWRNIEMLIIYLIHAEGDSLDELTAPEYAVAVEWLASHLPDYHVNLESVRQFFEILQEFYAYLAHKRLITATEELKKAADEIAGGDALKRLSSNGKESQLELLHANVTMMNPEEVDRQIGDIVERLMVKIGYYFQRQHFSNDFERALYLYSGPLAPEPPRDEQDEFWLGFWDYFLFDYHLIASDENPLQHFFHSRYQTLDIDERLILRDILKAQFTVFYINKILGPEWVECVDLFTGATIKLPYPDFEFHTFKRMLFYGHLYSDGVVMLNYITQVEVSPNLRQRIKEQVLWQQGVFTMQHPTATLADFFARHALVVRHTIDVLVSAAKVNVASVYQAERSFPVIAEVCTPDAEEGKALVALAKKYGLSLFDCQLLEKIWHDFSQLTVVTIRKQGIWAAAVLFCFMQINGNYDITQQQIAEQAGISASSLRNNRNKLFEVLQLQRFDPRYLNEEGFVLSLFVL